jgi:hypothetical protein
MLVCRKRDTKHGAQGLSGLQCLAAGSRAAGPLSGGARLRNDATGRRRGLVLGGQPTFRSQPPRVVPFFDRLPIVGQKAEDYRLWRSAVWLLAAGRLNDQDYAKVLALRERMNRGGKRRYRMHGILRDYTPSPQA